MLFVCRYDTGGDRLLLVEPQTITHVINDSSPFWEVGGESLRRERFEIIVILEGIVEASGRWSYTKRALGGSTTSPALTSAALTVAFSGDMNHCTTTLTQP